MVSRALLRRIVPITRMTRVPLLLIPRVLRLPSPPRRLRTPVSAPLTLSLTWLSPAPVTATHLPLNRLPYEQSCFNFPMAPRQGTVPLLKAVVWPNRLGQRLPRHKTLRPPTSG